VGPGLIAEPFFASAIFAGALLNQIDGTEAIIEQIGAGEKLFAVAHAERQARFTLNYVETKAKPTADGYVLDGLKIMVLHGDADADLIVLARSQGEAMDKDGLSLFHVAAGAAGLDIQTFRTSDSNIATQIDFRATPARLLGPENAAFEIFENAVAEATFALCAEAIGIMQATFDETLEYVKQRKQFGVPIGSFQVIQHRMSDCYMALEAARSMVLKSAIADRSDRAAWLKTIAGTKALVSEKAMQIGHEAIQFHGGMGVTDELIISHYHKRLHLISTLFGDVKTHIERFEAAA
ncbi:MAG: acyl-CoA dehydrogenase, partial [Pseudomonadota bacterium]